MSGIRIGLVIFLVILVSVQFVQPPRNQILQESNASVTSVPGVPDDVQAILRSSCYDCHSNNTHYPWYASIQPGAWWMASHIKEGKAELNFDEFGNYSKRRQLSKLKAIQGSVEDESMPLPSYIYFHSGASLSKTDKELLKNWTKIARDKLLQINQ